MARGKCNWRSVTDARVGVNPFADSLRIIMNKVRQDNTFEISEGLIVPKIMALDGVHSVKVFRDPDNRKIVAGLRYHTLQLYCWLQYSLLPGKDYVYIDSSRFMKECYVPNKTSYYRALHDLQRYGILARTCVGGVYFINPAYFFCGSRPRKYPDKVVKRVSRKRS